MCAMDLMKYCGLCGVLKSFGEGLSGCSQESVWNWKDRQLVKVLSRKYDEWSYSWVSGCCHDCSG